MCIHSNSKTIDTRITIRQGIFYRWRKRICSHCGDIYHTIEIEASDKRYPRDAMNALLNAEPIDHPDLSTYSERIFRANIQT